VGDADDARAFEVAQPGEDALDRLIEAYETKIGPRNGAARPSRRPGWIPAFARGSSPMRRPRPPRSLHGRLGEHLIALGTRRARAPKRPQEDRQVALPRLIGSILPNVREVAEHGLHGGGPPKWRGSPRRSDQEHGLMVVVLLNGAAAPPPQRPLCGDYGTDSSFL